MELRLLRYFVVVAEERNVGRAAARLNMTQPPLSRAIQQLENEMGTPLLIRTAHGVELTNAGRILDAEARALVERADALPLRITGIVEPPAFRIGILVDSADKKLSVEMVQAFRKRFPGVLVWLHEVDLTNPTAGLRSFHVDAAITRTPFDDSGLESTVLRRRAVGAVLPASDPLAGATALTTDDLADRTWAQIPTDRDPVYLDYWTLRQPGRPRPVVRTVQESLQEALWNGSVVIAPLDQVLPEGLVCVPLLDRPPTSIVVAWRTGDHNPVVQAFAEIAAAAAQPDDLLDDLLA